MAHPAAKPSNPPFATIAAARRSRRRNVATRLSCAVIATAATAGAQPPVINEVCYDPDGPDAGGEFVELYNAGPQPAALAGLRLEFANGADGPVWQLRWEATAADTIAAGGTFLIVDDGWIGEPPPQAEVDLGLQNGPDAVRLASDHAVIDLVGYGDLADPQLYEVQPAADVSSGQSLARRPDGHDTDVNAADLVPADPTPGGLNFARYELRLAALTCEPPSATLPGRDVQVTIVLTGAGLEPIGPADAQFWAGAAATTVALPLIAPGADGQVAAQYRPAVSGATQLGLVIPLPSSADSLRLDLGRYFVGAAALRIDEVMAAPIDGGEWIELVADTAAPTDLADFRLRDADGAWRGLPSLALAAGERVVLVQDGARFRTYWEQTWSAAGVTACLDGAAWERVLELPSWPALNNTAPEDRTYADRVMLADTAGTVDYVEVGRGAVAGEGEVVAGRSTERIAPVAHGSEAANWALCAASVGGTPGCANSVAAPGPPQGELSLTPNPFRAGEEVLHIRFALGPEHSAWDARIFDLWGRAVRDLGGDALGPGSRALIWDGRDDTGALLPPGGYIVLVRWRDADRNLTGGTKHLVALAAPQRP